MKAPRMASVVVCAGTWAESVGAAHGICMRTREERHVAEVEDLHGEDAPADVGERQEGGVQTLGEVLNDARAAQGARRRGAPRASSFSCVHVCMI